MALRQLINLREALFSRSGNQYLQQFRAQTKSFRNRSRQTETKQLLPFESHDSGNIDPSKVWKAFVFTGAFSVTTFATVSILQYERLRSRMESHILQTAPNFKWIKDKMSGKKEEVSELKREITALWNKLSSGEKVFVPLCALNVIVFGLWRVPRLQPFMLKYFTSNPAARAVCWPMLLSTFSHYSAFHIFANMYVLHSFSNGAVASLGAEQFLGVYLTGGVISSLASYMYKAAVMQPGLSLGASGAILTILAYICAKYPDTQLSIMFLPMFTFSAGSAIKVIMGLDLAGVILGWKFFDHAAHLGGAAFGLFWCYFGTQYVWPKGQLVVQQWHKLRGPVSKN
ncbi:presenilins-associated rhomboid-like protein, mitochondrial [Culicoides brevitarsis]|uniref:presenilins-associated rhomboid-like protein, mitochondrial n=1 Tax=Culicoides brevitarsis TaxID=469753 RepID=UPI00307B1194